MTGASLHLALRHTIVAHDPAPPSTDSAPLTAPLRHRESLFRRDTPLLAHANPKNTLQGHLAEQCAAAGMGVVYVTTSEKAMRELRRRHDAAGTANMLFDAARYCGNSRTFAPADLSAGWVSAQLRAGATKAITDSSYIPANSIEGLRSVLSQARAFKDVIAALPLAKWWLATAADTLVDMVNRAGIPVALMVEDRNDPFASAPAVSGLIHLLDHTTVPVLLLRCDASAIGAVAFGASHGAVGTSTSLRHIYPVTKRKGGGGHSPAIAAWVPRAMAFRTLENIGLAALKLSDDRTLWQCSCTQCAGESIEWIATEDEAAIHSLLSLAELTDLILADPVTARLAWIERCRTALSVNQEINADLINNWPVPAYLTPWVAGR